MRLPRQTIWVVFLLLLSVFIITPSYLQSTDPVYAMSDEFEAAASWLSSNPGAATLPNDVKLEVSPLESRFRFRSKIVPELSGVDLRSI